MDYQEINEVADRAMRLLGITPDEAKLLFAGDMDEEDLTDRVKDILAGHWRG